MVLPLDSRWTFLERSVVSLKKYQLNFLPAALKSNDRKNSLAVRKSEIQNSIFTELVDAGGVLLGVLLLLVDIWGCDDFETGGW